MPFTAGRRLPLMLRGTTNHTCTTEPSNRAKLDFRYKRDIQQQAFEKQQTEVAHLMVPVKTLTALQNAVSNKAMLKELSKEYNEVFSV